MPNYRLSGQAERDVERIGDDGMAKFGLAQAMRYHLAGARKSCVLEIHRLPSAPRRQGSCTI